jgi:hypothetical protein
MVPLLRGVGDYLLAPKVAHLAPENFANRSLISELVADHRLPAIYPSADYARSGGLMAYGTVFTDLVLF